MKRNRRILFLLWVLSLIGISLRGGPVTYGVFFVLTLVPVISLLYIRLVIVLFKIYQDLDGKDLTANHPAVFRFVLQNESVVLFSGVRVLFYSSFSSIGGLSDRIEYELLPKERIEKKTAVICRYRGNYEIGVKTIEVMDFFRLFKIAYRNPEPLRIRVKPDIVRIEELKNADLILSAMRDSRINPQEADVLMREYIPGDDPRLINWKASGAQGKLMIRERIGEQQEGIAVVMEPHRFSEQIEDYLPLENKILETVIALNLYLCEKGIPAENYILEDKCSCITTDRREGFEALYAILANYEFTENHTAKDLYAEIMKRSRIFMKKTVILVIHKWDAAADAFASELLRNNVAVSVYLISDKERDLPVVSRRISFLKIAADADLKEVL